MAVLPLRIAVFVGKGAGVVGLLMEIHGHGRNEPDQLSGGPRSPSECVYVRGYMSAVGVCACRNVYACVCVHIGTRAKHMGWKTPERATNNRYGGREKRVSPLSRSSRSRPTSAKDNGRKPRGEKEMGWGVS